MCGKICLWLLLICPAVLLAQGEPGRCKSYEPETVSLRGTLIRKTFPGPPNYESVRQGDKPETGWFLELDSSICVNEDKANPDLSPRQPDIKTVQLVLNAGEFKKYEPLVGKRVVAVGSLFGAHTAHHHTPVLLKVKTLQLAGER